MAPPRGGAGSARPQGRHRLDPGHVPARPPARRLSPGHHDIPRACVRPVFTGAETAPLRGNHLSVISGLSPIGLFPRFAPPAEGRAPHARNDGIGLAGACPHLATRYSFASDDHVMPRLASGLATRARRPRPSEKIAFRVISDLPPVGHLALDGPPRGGAGSARPQRRNWPRRSMSPFGHQVFVCPR
jgi:hypothetical protein